VARYLSPEWFDDLNAAARKKPGPPQAGSDRLCLQQVVTGTPAGDVRYWIRLDDEGAVTAGLGEVDSPDAVISQSYDTAVSVVRGDTRVQTALMSGEIRLAGIFDTLGDHREALRGLDATFSELRGRTSY